MTNKEIIKAMNKKEKKESKIKKWYNRNIYTIRKIVFFPIWVVAVIADKIEQNKYKKNKWNEERANEIFNYYVPRFAEWDKEDNEFYFFDNGFGWDLCRAKKHLKRKDRVFWECNNGWSGGKLRLYLLDEFELEGFTKEVLNDDDGCTEIVFKKN